MYIVDCNCEMSDEVMTVFVSTLFNIDELHVSIPAWCYLVEKHFNFKNLSVIQFILNKDSACLSVALIIPVNKKGFF